MDEGEGEADARAIRRALTTLSAERLGDETLASRAAKWLLGGPRPGRSGSPSLVASRLLARAAILRGDDAMWGWVHPRLGGDGEDRLLVAWRELQRGGGVSEEAFDALARDARSRGRGDLLVEVEALRAWARVERGDSEDALEVARRAYLMGRSEELPLPAFLASIVLARVRRHVGQPARGAHILRTLKRFAPAPWHGWIDAELTFCEGPPDAFATWLEALDGTRYAPLARDRLRLLEALGWVDVRTAEVRRWSTGQGDEVPFGFHAFGASDGTNAFAVAFDDGSRRRVLGASESWLRERGVTLVRGTGRRREGRAPRVLAALLLAGPEGCETAELFQLGYGVRYVEDIHRGVLDVQLHRCRKLLPEGAQLERLAGRLRLTVRQPLAVADPRCSRRGDERLLQLLGRAQRLDAKGAARQLGVSRRAAASALKELAEEGLCAVDQAARGQLVYHVEDSLFHSPTQTLERPAWLTDGH